MKTFLRSLAVDLALACLCSAALVSLLGAASPKLRERQRAKAVAVARTREVLGTEISFAGPASKAEDVRRSVASVDAFVRRRGGVSLAPPVAARLAELELRTLDGRMRRITVDELSGVFAEVLCERIRDLSDDEIESTADAFGNVISMDQFEDVADDFDTRFALAKRARGTTFGAPTKAAHHRNDVMLRFDGSAIMPAERFVSKLKEIRAMLMAPQMFALVTAQGRDVLDDYLGERVDTIGEALPESWGAARSSGLTPVQAILLAYSAASDDAMIDTSSRLVEKQDRYIEAYLRRVPEVRTGGYRPPYGRYGDVFSTPLDAVFDERTLGRLLTEIEQRGAR